MKLRAILIAFLIIVVAGGLIAGLFFGPIQTMLTIPAANQGQQANPGGNKPTPVVTPNQGATPALVTPTVPGANGTAVPAVTPTPMPGQILQLDPANIVAQDTFQRQNQNFWGTSSDGKQWNGDANRLRAFSISNGVGQIARKQGNVDGFNALLGAEKNVEVIAEGSINFFDGRSNIGVVLRYQDNEHWYKLLIDGTNLTILKRVQEETTTLESMAFPAQSGTIYALRFRAAGAMLFAKAWLKDGPEPSGWMLTVSDNTYENGSFGLRMLLQRGSVVNITSFIAARTEGVI